MHAWSRWPQRKGVCHTLQSRKNYALFPENTGFLLLLFLFFFCAFWRSACFASCKRSVAFFCCCCLRQFWLCLFVRLRAFPAAISLSCLRLLLASIITWTSPFPLVFSCLLPLFLQQQKMFAVFCSFAAVFVDVFLGGAVRFFCAFCCAFFARLTKQYIRLTLPIFAGSKMLFLLSFGAFWRCCIFFLAPRLGHACLKMPPLPSFMVRVTHFLLRSTPQHSYTPFRPICVAVHPLHGHTYGYVCVGVCMCFCVVVGRTACARMVAIELASVSVFGFCVCLGVCG